MSSLMMKIDMNPAMNELCSLEGTCSLAPDTAASSLSNSLFRHRNASSASLSNSYLSHSSSSANIMKEKVHNMAFEQIQGGDLKDLQQRIYNIIRDPLTPDGYKESLIKPFYEKLASIPSYQFAKALVQDEMIQRIAQAILQNFDTSVQSQPIAMTTTMALRELISDLYQTFLKRKCSSGVAEGCKKISSPVPNWLADEEGGLSTYGSPRVDLKIGMSIVNVPKRYSTQSAIAWGCLGHEVVGHDILMGAYPRLIPEIKQKINSALVRAGLSGVSACWNDWLEEAVPDIMGFLHLGPSAAFSLIGFLRSVNSEATYNEFKLSPYGHLDDPHPVDLVRGFLMVATAQKLAQLNDFEEAKEYTNALIAEVNKDAEGVESIFVNIKNFGYQAGLEKLVRSFYKHQDQIFKAEGIQSHRDRNEYWLDKAKDLISEPETEDEFIKFLRSQGIDQTKKRAQELEKEGELAQVGRSININIFKQSCEIVARIVLFEKMAALQGQSLYEIRSWKTTDEKTTQVFRRLIQLPAEDDPVDKYKEGHFACHVVSAAVMESITLSSNIQDKASELKRIFQRMVMILGKMQQTNPEWQKSLLIPALMQDDAPASTVSKAYGLNSAIDATK
jgi:hypothetical protein